MVSTLFRVYHTRSKNLDETARQAKWTSIGKARLPYTCLPDWTYSFTAIAEYMDTIQYWWWNAKHLPSSVKPPSNRHSWVSQWIEWTMSSDDAIYNCIRIWLLIFSSYLRMTQLPDSALTSPYYSTSFRQSCCQRRKCRMRQSLSTDQTWVYCSLLPHNYSH